ncbi:MAG: hypothetical protein JXD23_03770 [Spirochaetales bacterium]|nr:hypothetical protein [Spirochaetales bacterium]
MGTFKKIVIEVKYALVFLIALSAFACGDRSGATTPLSLENQFIVDRTKAAGLSV